VSGDPAGQDSHQEQVNATAASAALRAKFGVLTQDEAKDNAFARILLLGPAKAGKTTCIAGTAPKPLVINCDGLSATKGARLVHKQSRFLVAEAQSRAGLINAVKAAEALVAAGDVRTVILDTATLLVDNILDEVTKAGFEGWDRWEELEKAVMGSVKKLASLEAHLFVISRRASCPQLEGSSKPGYPRCSTIGFSSMWIRSGIRSECSCSARRKPGRIAGVTSGDAAWWRRTWKRCLRNWRSHHEALAAIHTGRREWHGYQHRTHVTRCAIRLAPRGVCIAGLRARCIREDRAVKRCGTCNYTPCVCGITCRIAALRAGAILHNVAARR
jgi:hypothetical protein